MVKYKTNEFSVVYIYKNIDLFNMPLNEIKKEISINYNHTTNIIITQFPDIITILLPTEQVFLTIENTKIVIINKKIGNLIDRKTNEFSKVCWKIYDVIKKASELTAWGINITEGTDLSSKLLDKYINSSLHDIIGVVETDLKSSAIKINFTKNKFDYALDLIPFNNLINFHINKHLIGVNELNNFESINSEIIKVQEELREYIVKIV